MKNYHIGHSTILNTIYMKLIEIIIAMILVYAMFSILTSILVELWNSVKKTRGKMLRNAIYQMLDDSLNLNYGALLLNHPLVNSMQNKMENRPFQYLHSGIFADALIDIIAEQDMQSLGKPNTTIIEAFNKGINNMNESPFKRMLELMSLKATGYNDLKLGIEDWYNRNNERTTGWYKRKQKRVAFTFGLLIAVFLNIDSIHLLKVISMDANLRSNLVQASEGIVADYSLLDSTEKLSLEKQINVITASINKIETDTTAIAQWYLKTNAMLNRIKLTDSVNQSRVNHATQIIGLAGHLQLPLGYSKSTFPRSRFLPNNEFAKLSESNHLSETELGTYLYKRNFTNNWETFMWWLIGMLITALMLSVGAPFWFELLVKFVNIRKAGIKPTVKPTVKP